MVGLIKTRLAAQGVGTDWHRIRELPAHRRLRGGRGVRNLDEGILRGSRKIAGNHLVSLGVTGGGRRGIGRGGVPAHFKEARVQGRRHHLEGALTLHRYPDAIHATRDVRDRADGRCRDRLIQSQCHRAQGRAGTGRGRIVHLVDQGTHEGAGLQLGRVDHQVVASRRLKIGRTGEGNHVLRARGIARNIGDAADDDPVGDPRIACRRGRIGAAVHRAHELGRVDRHRIRHRDGHFLDEGLLEKAGLGRGRIGLLALLNDLGRHHHDGRNGGHDEA